MNIGRVVVRTTLGGYFAAHGVQMLLGWFDGDGLDVTAARFESVGIRPGKLNARLAGATEAGGGVALAVGAGTPVAAAGLIATMITAIRKVHLPNGPFIQKHGYEYPLVAIGVLLTIAEDGPGDPAFDKSGRGRSGALAALAAGVVGSLLVDVVGQHIAGRAPVATGRPEASAPVETPAPTEVKGDEVTVA